MFPHFLPVIFAVGKFHETRKISKFDIFFELVWVESGWDEVMLPILFAESHIVNSHVCTALHGIQDFQSKSADSQKCLSPQKIMFFFIFMTSNPIFQVSRLILNNFFHCTKTFVYDLQINVLFLIHDVKSHVLQSLWKYHLQLHLTLAKM